MSSNLLLWIVDSWGHHNPHMKRSLEQTRWGFHRKMSYPKPESLKSFLACCHDFVTWQMPKFYAPKLDVESLIVLPTLPPVLIFSHASGMTYSNKTILAWINSCSFKQYAYRSISSWWTARTGSVLDTSGRGCTDGKIAFGWFLVC